MSGAEAGCTAPAPPMLLQGVAEFNAGRFYACHETLEALWMSEPAAVRELYQGILQVGVGFYKQERGQYRGAVSLLKRGLAHLAPYAPTCRGVDVARLMSEAAVALEAIERLGPERIRELDRRLLPRIHRLPV